MSNEEEKKEQEGEKTLQEFEASFRGSDFSHELGELGEMIGHHLAELPEPSQALTESHLFFYTRALPRLTEALLKRGELSSETVKAVMDLVKSVCAVCARLAPWDVPELWKLLAEVVFDRRKPFYQRNSPTKSDTPGLFIEVINAFSQDSGFDAIVSRLKDSSHRRVSLELLRSMLKPIAQIRDVLTDKFMKSFCGNLEMAVEDVVATVTAEDVKAEKRDTVVDIMRYFSTIVTFKGCTFAPHSSDILTLVLAELLFRIPVMEKRFAGFKEIVEMSLLANNSRCSISKREMVEWIKKNSILERLLEHAHVELLKRSSDLFKLVAQEHALGPDTLETLWHISKGSHESTQAAVFGVFSDLVASRFEQDFVQKHLAELPLRAFLFGPLRNLLITLGKHSVTGDHGMQILWQLIQDTGPLPGDVLLDVCREFATLIKLHAKSKVTYMRLASENVAKHVSVAQSLVFIMHCAGTFKDKRSEIERRWPNETISGLDKETSLFDSFIADVEHFKEVAATATASLTDKERLMDFVMPGMILPYRDQLDQRLEFLNHLLISCPSIVLDKPRADRLWDSLVLRALAPKDRTSAFDAFIHIGTCAEQTFQPLPDEIAEHLFAERFSHFNVADLVKEDMTFFDYFFRYLNWRKDKFLERNRQWTIKKFDLIGMDVLWRITFETKNEEAGTTAIDDLIKIQKTLEAPIRPYQMDYFEDYVQRCIAAIASACDALLGEVQPMDPEAPRLQISRALRVLNLLMSSFDSNGQSHLSKCRGAPISVNIKPLNGTAFALSLRSLDPLDTLKQAIGLHLGSDPLSFRLVSQGKQLTEGSKTLESLRITDGTTVHVVAKPNTADPDKEKNRETSSPIPSNVEPSPVPISDLLSKPTNFATLFRVLNIPGVTAIRGWEVICQLPTDKAIRERLWDIKPSVSVAWSQLLDPHNLFAFLYSLIILQSLAEPASGDAAEEERRAEWRSAFIKTGGTAHLVSVLCDGSLAVETENTAHQREALSHTMSIVAELVLGPKDTLVEHALRGTVPLEKLVGTLLNLVRLTIEKPLSKILDVELARNAVHVLVACFATNNQLFDIMKDSDLYDWLKTVFVTGTSESAQEQVCNGFQHLCLDFESARKISGRIIVVLLDLISFFEENHSLQTCDCYFRLLTTIIPHETAFFAGRECLFLDKLIGLVRAHPVVEDRSMIVEDKVLQGLLQTLKTLVSTFPDLKLVAGQQRGLLKEVFDKLLFDMPTAERHGPDSPPKCKTHGSRSRAFELLGELCRGCEKNEAELLEMLLNQNKYDERRKIPWYYVPHGTQKAACGYVGLRNLGATCYMNSVLQQMFMNPRFRFGLLTAPVPEPPSEGDGAEWTGAPLQELQKLFASLQETERRAVDTSPFVSVLKIHGEPVNAGIQMDAEEFLGALLDTMETLFKGTKHEKLVQDVFSGTVCHQIIPRSCGHVSEREEGFYTLQLVVQGKKNLAESLESFVEGELLTGENQYHCDQCNAKVDAVKRCCLKRLPETIFIHCKRFEYDLDTMRRFKVNDEYRFPERINLERYTKEGLDVHDGKAHSPSSSPSPQSPTDYVLSGVVIHMGTADSGHYYSFIKDKERGTWLQFNDQNVETLEDSQFEANTVGGYEYGKFWDSAMNQYSNRSHERNYNAYMLVYTKAEALHQECKLLVENPSQHVPPQIYSSVWEDNTAFLHDINVFDADYFSFVTDVFAKRTAESDSQTAVEFATRFAFDTMAHAKEHAGFKSFVEQLQAAVTRQPSSAVSILKSSTESDARWIKQLLLECPDDDVRTVAAGFFNCALEAASKISCALSEVDTTVALPAQPPSPSGSSSSSRKKGRIELPEEIRYVPTSAPLSPVAKFMDALLLCMPDVWRYWHTFGSYFEVIARFAESGTENAQFLLSRRAFAQMGDLLLGELSPFRMDVKPPKMGDKYGKPDFRSLVRALAAIIKNCGNLADYRENSGVCLALSEVDKELLFGTALYCKAISVGEQTPAAAHMIEAFCVGDDAASRQMIKEICDLIDDAQFEDFPPFFEAVRVMLRINDEFRSTRIAFFLQEFALVMRKNSRYQKATYFSARFIAELAKEFQEVSKWVWENRFDFAPLWLLESSHDIIRDMAAEILSIAIGMPVDVPPVPASFRPATVSAGSTNINSASTTSQNNAVTASVEAQSVAPLSLTEEQTSALGPALRNLLEFLLKLVPMAQKAVQGDEKTFKLVSYAKLMRRCLVGSAQQNIWQTLSDTFFDLLWTVEKAQRENDENKSALIAALYGALLGNEQNIKLFVSSDHMVKLLDSAWSVKSATFSSRSFLNTAMLPYYSLLKVLCMAEPQALNMVTTHKHWKFAIETIVADSYSDYPEPARIILEILKLALRTPHALELKTHVLNTILQKQPSYSNGNLFLTALVTVLEFPADAMQAIENKALTAITSLSEAMLPSYNNPSSFATQENLLLLSLTLQTLLKLLADVPPTLKPRRDSILVADRKSLAKNILTALFNMSAPDNVASAVASAVALLADIDSVVASNVAEALSDVYSNAPAMSYSPEPLGSGPQVKGRPAAIVELAKKVISKTLGGPDTLDSGLKLGMMQFLEQPEEDLAEMLLEAHETLMARKQLPVTTLSALLVHVAGNPHFCEGNEAHFYLITAFSSLPESSLAVQSILKLAVEKLQKAIASGDKKLVVLVSKLWEEITKCKAVCTAASTKTPEMSAMLRGLGNEHAKAAADLLSKK